MKITKLTILTLLTILLLSGCFFLPQNQIADEVNGDVSAYPRREGSFADVTQEEKISISAEGKIIDANISGWKTYINEAYGFKISYPEEWRYHQINLGSSYRSNCVGFNRFPKTAEEMNKYKDLIVNFYICKVYDVELIEYLQNLGYQVDSSKNSGKVLQFVGGAEGDSLELEMEKIIFKSYSAIKFSPENPQSTYSLYIQKDKDIYFVRYSAYPDQYSERDLDDIIDTIDFLPEA